MIDKEIEVLRTRRVELDAAGLQTEKLEQRALKLRADAVAEDARQEFLKAEGKASTVRVTAAYDTLYEAGSGLLDAIVGVIGKNSDEGKILLRMRSQIRRPRAPSTPDAAVVLPVKKGPTQ